MILVIFGRGGKDPKTRKWVQFTEEKLNCQLLISLTFYSILFTSILVIMFEKFRKDHVEHEESSGSEMVEERPKEEPEHHNTEKDVSESQSQTVSSSSEGQIGIRALKDKRVKLEEAIDYVGLMTDTFTGDSSFGVEATTNAESDKILQEASAVAESAVSEKFPSMPVEQATPSSTSTKYM